ncbi:MAG: cation:dicarboxylate symporter family transporter [Alphaproteobacteria bacterium]
MKSFTFPKLSIPLQLLIVILAAFLIGDFMPESVKAVFYGISLTLKDILLFSLPAIIFSCLFSCMLSFENRALTFVIALFIGVCFSSFIAVMAGYGIGSFSLSFIDVSLGQVSGAGEGLLPAWSYELPKLISNEVALLAGLVGGGIFSVAKIKAVDKYASYLQKVVYAFLMKCFIPLLPLFAFGFVLKMQHDGLIVQIFSTYAVILSVITVSFMVYLYLLYGAGAQFNLSRWHEYIRNILPSGILGFSTMSSMAAMPLTMQGAEDNTKDPNLARAVIPATVNIHMIGDCIGIPIMALAIMVTYDFPLPSLAEFLPFAMYFVIARFAVAGVPGAGILVILPLLESHFGFTGEMTALITALYILFDPVNTATNVTGNGAFAIIFAKVFKSQGSAAAEQTT